ncbi:Hypothetical protein IALB_2367 [Ignavibacterium album JCM 16511]|uniref:Uncharacterized protein n=1 Tax=Ignavibacterium album (strain DSM 19864 / JCM 16511 / NBRC 101810 / Mat9-16) TaxID=945713 RepID=I0AM63_IGNAJ|nr:hypothetical protein [Ignavibacterium album]AFH50070.1 Hypothetical protein IALB_2367 [Ignavibacterium album JCM 16511]
MTTTITHNFLDEVESFTERKLHHKIFLQQLIDEANKNDTVQKFEELAFTGKYVSGLFRAIKIGQANPEVTNLQMIKEDLMKNIEKVITLIKEMTSNLNAEVFARINTKFIELSKDQFNNITQLVDDLNQVKKYLNYIKRNFS